MNSSNPTPPADEAPITLKAIAAVLTGRPEIEHDDSISDDEADRLASEAIAAMKERTARQDAEIAAAFAAAQALIDERGPEDPQAVLAWIRAVDLQDPSYFEREFKARGIEMPLPSHFTEDGRPMWSVTDIAKAAGVSLDEAEAAVDLMALEGMAIRPNGPVHRAQ